MQQSNELATKGPNALSTAVAPKQGVLRTDIIVPYVLIGQASSEYVKEKKAEIGDIVRSTTHEKLGDPESPIDVIVLHNPKPEWVIEVKEKDRFRFKGVMDRNAANETLPWNYWADEDGNEVPEGTKGAKEWRRVKRLSFFGILPGDLAAAEAEQKKVEAGELPDPNKALTPVLFSIRSSSYKAGKEITTFFSKAQSMNVPIWWYQIKMGCVLEKNDDGSFYVWVANTVAVKGVPKEQRPLIQSWVEMLNAGVNFQVDENADEGAIDVKGVTVDAQAKASIV